MKLCAGRPKLARGVRGKRDSPSAAAKAEILEALAHHGLPAPAYLSQDTAWIDRRAKLFEAGDYPDKGVSVSVEQLQSLAAGFDLPVPVLIEHAASPIELGYLTQVEVVDSELVGTIALTAEADRMLERSQARSLSLGLEADLSAIREVSIVRKPRVKDAQMFSGLSFEASLSSGDPWRERYESLIRVRRQEEAEAKVNDYLKQGKLTPAQAGPAKALLMAEGAICFDGESKPVSQLLAELVEAAPTRVHFGELAPGGTDPDYSQHLMLPEEAAFYRRHFPDIQLDQIAQRR